MSKITKIPSEIRNFFTGKRINPAFSKFMTLLEGMRISDKDLGGKKRENCQLTNLQLFQIILILPFKYTNSTFLYNYMPSQKRHYP